MKSVQIRVYGKVQGVWFRASTKREADTYNINGYVKNCDNGTVLIEAEGEAKILDKFIKWCEVGPEFAHVEKCDVTYKNVKHYTLFQILR